MVVVMASGDGDGFWLLASGFWLLVLVMAMWITTAPRTNQQRPCFEHLSTATDLNKAGPAA